MGQTLRYTQRELTRREAEAQRVNGGLFCTAHPLPVCSSELHHLGDALSHEDCTRLDQVFSDHYKFSGVSTYHFSAYCRCRTERQEEWKAAWKCRGCIFAWNGNAGWGSSGNTGWKIHPLYLVLFGLLRAIKQGDETRVFTLTPGQGLFILPLSLG